MGGTVVVDCEPLPATAMTGAMAGTVGVEVVTPEGTTELLGYDWHVKVKALPATVSESPALESCWMVMSGLVAVNPDTVEGVSGSDNGTPSSGTGLGIVTLKLNGPCGVVAGVAPLASIWVVAEPIKVGDSAAAAPASAAGRFTTVW